MDWIDQIDSIRAKIVKQIADEGLSHGEINCPVCDLGELSYRQMDNGHIHAWCNTEDCVQWQE